VNAIDRAIVRATQAGLPLVSKPYAAISRESNIPEEEVLLRMNRMLADGRIRRIGAVPNHYALGYTANAMTVWDVADEAVDELGRQVGALAFVSHCYRRPRRLPDWRYNLFAMVHGRSRSDTGRLAGEIHALLGKQAAAFEILYSMRILKKTGLRLA
jgi:DNA-binding Lrp family transcriptional regulator